MSISKSSLKKVIILYYVVCIYLNSYCYFMWTTYNSYTAILVLTWLAHLSVVFLFAYMIIYQCGKRRVSFIGLMVILLSLIFQIHMAFLGKDPRYQYIVADFFVLLSIITLVIIDVEEKADIFEYALKLFVFLCLPAFLYFILTNIGITLPYNVLQSAHDGKRARGLYYEHYPLGLIATSPWESRRYCGVFDEPGVVGTLAALFFAGGYKKVNKKWLVVLVLEGFFSLSMAFYILMIIFASVKCFQAGLHKVALITIAGIMGLNFFINTNFDNEYLSLVQNRINLSSSFLIEDNRTSSSFDNEFQGFADSGGYEFLFGKGRGNASSNSAMSSSASYKTLIYDFGIIGFSILLCILFLCLFFVRVSKDSVAFFVVFLISIYQRPWVFNIEYMTILLAGLGFISAKNSAISRVE